MLLSLCKICLTRIAGQPCWKPRHREITTKCMETMVNRNNVRGINRLLNPLKGLSATITCINNDVLIAPAKKIVLCKDNYVRRKNTEIIVNVPIKHLGAYHNKTCVNFSLFWGVTSILEEQCCHYHTPPPKP